MHSTFQHIIVLLRLQYRTDATGNMFVSLQENLDTGITIDQLSLYLILFADDAVVFSDTPE